MVASASLRHSMTPFLHSIFSSKNHLPIVVGTPPIVTPTSPSTSHHRCRPLLIVFSVLPRLESPEKWPMVSTYPFEILGHRSRESTVRSSLIQDMSLPSPRCFYSPLGLGQRFPEHDVKLRPERVKGRDYKG